jgi:hypothetical protein
MLCNVGLSHHGMACPAVNGGDDLQMLTKQSRTANKMWFSSLGVGQGANISLDFAGPCEHGNQLSSSIEAREFLD